MSAPSKGRTEPCKDNIGGLKEIWLSTFTSYPANLIAGYRDMLITSFPSTLLFQYEGVEKTFSETFNNDNFYDQEINITYTKQQLSEAQALELLIKKKVIAVIVDLLGNIRVAGLHNGLDIDFSSSSGGARVEFNGYRLKLTGVEELQAPNLSSFPGSGFEKEGVTYDCLLASSDRPASLLDLVSSCNIVQ